MSNLDELDLSNLLADDPDLDGISETYSEFTEPSEPKPEVKPNVSKETAPKRIRSIGSRRSTETLFTGVYGLVGTGLVHTGTDVPVGRVLMFQAPIAGARLDEIIAGTWLDKLIQPLVSYQDKAEGIGSLLLLPVLVGAFERKPELAGFPIFEQILRKVVESSVEEMAPLLKKQATDRKKAARTVADWSELGLEGEALQDPIGAIIGGFFYMPEDVKGEE